MIDTILFDMDNTILDFNKAERNALTKALTKLDIEPTEHTLRRYHELNIAQWKLLELGKLTRKEVKLRRYRLLFEELGVERSPEKAVEIYEGFLGQGHFYMEGAEELLQSLSQSYRLYIVTNGTASVQKGRVESAGLRNYVRDIFVSEALGYNKPDRRYFELCFAQIPDFHRENAIIVGDSLSSDIQGGINAGLTTVWLNTEGAVNDTGISPDYEISTLSELKKLLTLL
jgi:2-haloacid dehalogenase